MPKRALVLEGGAMRGIFTAGVLDGFLEQQYNPFDFVIGVSAGSTNGIGYLCGQLGRSHKIITEFATSADFIDMVRWLRGGHFCDVDWLWRQSFDDIWLDVEHYQQLGIPLYVVTTSVTTGKPCYLKVTPDNMHQLFPASCAIPLAYRDFPKVNGEPMTDGGVGDSIPVIKAYQQGARDITVVLSRALGYKKKVSKNSVLVRQLFKELPELQDAIIGRNENYNQALEFINNPPADCQIHVIAPPDDFKVGRFTRDRERLEAGYQQGLSIGRLTAINAAGLGGIEL
ncbi:patatin-like phospholipase family protein [Idiomarina seosinensis]|nr:patatin family protein [Idiomarina seosinensis]